MTHHPSPHGKTHRVKTARRVLQITPLILALTLTSGCGLPSAPSLDDAPEPTASPSVTVSPRSKSTPTQTLEPSAAATTASPSPTAPDATASEVVYWYESTLPSNLRPAYEETLKGVQNFEESIQITQSGLTQDDASLIYNTLFAEHPTWFYMSLSYSTMVSNETKEVKAIKPKYGMTREEWLSKLNEVNAVVDPLVKQINASAKTDYEKELAAHDWLVRNVVYRNDPSLSGSRSYQTVYGAFVEKQANCMGYSSAMLYLMRRLGISATIVQGIGYDPDGSSEAHEWNMIKIDGQWWHVDACWDDPQMNDSDADRLRSDIRHGYMNLTDAEIAKDHKIEKVNRLGDPPKTGANASSVNYYRRNGMYVTSMDQYSRLVREHFGEILDGRPLDVQFADDSLYRQATDNDVMSKIIQDAAEGHGLSKWSWATSTSPAVRVVVLTMER